MERELRNHHDGLKLNRTEDELFFVYSCVLSGKMADTMRKTKNGGEHMAKAGMRRPDPGDPHGTESDQTLKRRIDPRVPEIQGKAKTGKAKAGNIQDTRP